MGGGGTTGYAMEVSWIHAVVGRVISGTFGTVFTVNTLLSKVTVIMAFLAS